MYVVARLYVSLPDGSLPAHVVLSPNQKILNNWLNNWQPRVGLAYRVTVQMRFTQRFNIVFDKLPLKSSRWIRTSARPGPASAAS